jgi:hypothetical protein
MKKKGPQIETADGLRREKLKTHREINIPDVYVCNKKENFLENGSVCEIKARNNKIE